MTTKPYAEITPLTDGSYFVSVIYASPDDLHRGCQCCSLQPSMEAATLRAMEDSDDIRINPMQEAAR